MSDCEQEAGFWEAVAADTRDAVLQFDDALSWLERSRARRAVPPLSAEVWVIDPDFTRVLLVRHRWRGWVPPGGKVEVGETPRQAAVRELREETGLQAELLAEPAAVVVRSYRADWAPTLGLSYAAVADPQTPLGGESEQPPCWWSLDDEWESVFPSDRDRIRAYARRLEHLALRTR